MASAGRPGAPRRQRPRLPAPDGQPGCGGRCPLLRPRWRRNGGRRGRTRRGSSHRQPLLN
eukprot:280583-Alexandrium_andersonii.AAC.1